VIPIALLYLIWRRWRFVFGFASLALAETVASIWLVGTSQFITYARSLITLGGGVHEVTKPVANLMANLHGLVFGLTGGNLPGFWIVAVTAILSGIVLLLAAFSHRMDARSGDAFLIAVTACALVSYYLLIHDLSIMLIPVAVSLDRNIAAEAIGHQPGRLMARAAALMFVAPVCESFIPFHFYIVALPLCIFFFALLRTGQYRN